MIVADVLLAIADYWGVSAGEDDPPLPNRIVAELDDVLARWLPDILRPGEESAVSQARALKAEVHQVLGQWGDWRNSDPSVWN